ncbi:MAG: ABC transporter ATP-binding protein [Pseudoclavibacter sp.]
MTASPVLSVRGLRVGFRIGDQIREVVHGIDLDIARGEMIAIVGESGSGKSTTASAINRLLPSTARVTAERIDFEGEHLDTFTEKQMRSVRGGRIGYVPQDPMTGLNPVMRVGKQIAETLRIHGHAAGAEAHIEAQKLMRSVGITDVERRSEQYPHQFSGGMKQRVLIAMALACRPSLLIADEPTSALDVTVQRTILDQIAQSTRETGTSVILITHDLAMAAERADRILVMHRGVCVEQGSARDIIDRPQHEYTRRLLAAEPSLAVTPRRDTATPTQADVVLEARNLRKEYAGKGGAFAAVDGVSFRLRRGETLGIVGESGSGKSTTAAMALGLEKPTSGEILLDGADATRLRSRAQKLALRRRIQPVFQNPFASLDPRMTIAKALEEPLAIHRIGSAAERSRMLLEALDKVALPSDALIKHPHELSGGQNQRVAIARALLLNPEIIVLDEAVSALDVLVQAQVLDLLADLKRDLGVSYLFISHDLAVVRMIADEVHVMKAGKVVEMGTPEEIFEHPQHAYTRALLDAIPHLHHAPA